MEQLKTLIEKKGFLFKLKERTSKTALYEQYKDDKLMAYEVFKIKHHNGFTFPNGSYKEPGEAYPRDEDFGVTAWSFGVFSTPERALERAQEKYTQLNLQENETISQD